MDFTTKMCFISFRSFGSEEGEMGTKKEPAVCRCLNHIPPFPKLTHSPRSGGSHVTASITLLMWHSGWSRDSVVGGKDLGVGSKGRSWA